MKAIKKLSVGLFATLVVGLVPAVAAHALVAEYLIGGKIVTAGTLLTIEGELLLEDMKGGLFGEGVDLLCSFLGLAEIAGVSDLKVTSLYKLGAADPEGAGEVACEDMAGVCPEPDVQAVKLPWLLEPIEEPGTFRGKLLRSAMPPGAPGWLARCEKFEAGATECTGEAGTVLLENSGMMMNANFENTFNANAYTCTRGGAKEGLIEGILLFETTNGEAFAVS